MLEDLIDSLPVWHNLLRHLEGEISRPTIANMRSLVPALSSEENVRLRLWQN